MDYFDENALYEEVMKRKIICVQDGSFFKKIIEAYKDFDFAALNNQDPKYLKDFFKTHKLTEYMNIFYINGYFNDYFERINENRIDLSKILKAEKLPTMGYDPGIVTQDGMLYYRYGEHRILNEWLNLNGVDTTSALKYWKYKRVPYFAEMAEFIGLPANGLILTPPQIFAMKNICGDYPMHEVLLNSRKLGFELTDNDDVRRRNIACIDNTLGKGEVYFGEIYKAMNKQRIEDNFLKNYRFCDIEKID